MAPRRQLDEAEIACRQVLAVASAIGTPTQLRKAQVARGRLCAARQRRAEAGDTYRAARAMLDRVEAGLQNPRLHASLGSTTQVPELTSST